MEGFNSKIISNLSLTRLNFTFVVQVVGSLTSCAIFVINYKWYVENDDGFDHSYVSILGIMILIRSFVIGTKFATFSDERMDLLKEVELSDEILTYDLTLFFINNVDTNFFLRNIQLIMEELKIDDDLFNFGVYKNQK